MTVSQPRDTFSFWGSYTAYLALLLGLIGAVYVQVWTGKAVIYPHDNCLELHLAQGCREHGAPGREAIQNRKFSDESSVFVPELYWHLNGRQSSWLSLWNPAVELGRPVFQLSGIGEAWLVTRLVSLFSDNAFSVYSYLSVLAIVLTGIFSFLFLKDLRLGPPACFAGSAFLVLGVLMNYWATFALFNWGLCWSVASLLSISRILYRPGLGWGAALSFSTYSLLLSAYPQTAIYAAYLLALFLGVRLVSKYRNGDRLLRPVLIIMLSGLLGVVAASPAYLDVYLMSLDSPRLAADPAFFLQVLPRLQSLADYVVFLGGLMDAYVYGNPIRSSYPFAFNGLSLTPVYAVLRSSQPSRPWLVFAGLCLLATLWSSVYAFMVKYLGFSISRAIPAGAAFIPFAVIAAYVVDRVQRAGMQGAPRPLKTPEMLLAGGLPVFLVGNQLRVSDSAFEPAYVVSGLLLVGATVRFLRRGSASLLVVLVIGSAWLYSAPLVLKRPQHRIALESPLTNTIKEHLANGQRLAWVGERVIPANQEILLGIASIHSYNSLSSRFFQDWAGNFNARARDVYGRQFSEITHIADSSRAMICQANIGLLISRQPLDLNFVKRLDTPGELFLYQTDCDGSDGLLAAYRLAPNAYAGETALPLSRLLPKDAGTSRVGHTVNSHYDDLIELTLDTPGDERLVLVRQQYHAAWKAYAAGRELRTLRVDGIYLGVVIPPGVVAVKLVFRPYVWWAWIPEVLYLLVFLGMLFSAAWKGSHSVRRSRLA